jgi:AcrR family transcriptional regulator
MTPFGRGAGTAHAVPSQIVPKKRPAGDSAVDTRERILRAAAELFTRRSYAGTTTRQIAEEVGIQQPSLFYHFPSKAHIVDALLEWDLGKVMPFLRRLDSRDEAAEVRLYAYLAFDIQHLVTSPYSLVGLYSEDVMGDERFARWAKLIDERRAIVTRTVQSGIDEGVLVPVSAALASETITGVILGVLTFHSGEDDQESVDPDAVVSIVLRGLLRNPDELQNVRSSAARLVAMLDEPSELAGG